MRKPLQNVKLFFFVTVFLSLCAITQLSAQQILLPVEVLGAEGKIVTRTFDLSSQEAGRAAKLWMQVNNLSYQNKGSVKINNGAWITLNHQTVTMQAQEKARGGMVHGGFNTIRFSIPVSGLIAGTNTISFRFDLSDGISNGFRVVKFNLMDAGSGKILADSRFKQEDPTTWVGPYTDATSIQQGKDLWYNATLKSNWLPAGRKGFWYGAEVKGQEVIKAKCSSCHTQDGRDLEIFSYSNESIVERAKFHQLTEDEGKKIASYIRSLSTTKTNVGRWGRPWNPPYQPGPAVANMPVQQWAAGAGLDAVLDEDKDMVPYLFPNGINQQEVYNHFDSDKTLDRTTLPLSIQFPDWKHWLPLIHPMDAYSKNDYYNQAGKQYDPKKGYTDFRNYLTAQDPASRNKAELMQKSGEFRTHYRFFLAQGSPSGIGGHWRTTDGTATANLADGVSREMAATSLARLLAVQYFEIFNEFNLQDKAKWFMKTGEGAGDIPKDRQWFGDDYHVFEVPPHFQACVNNDCNQFVGQPTATGFYESTNWYHLQLVIGGGEGMMSWNSPVDYNYHPDFLTKSSNSSGIYEPLRYYHSMNAMYQTRTWIGGQNPNDGKGFRIRVMGPWNIYGITDGNQFNGFAPGEFAKQLDKVEPGMTAWVLNAMLRQFLKEVNKPYNSLSGWNRTPDGDDNSLDRADKTYADILDALQRTERQEGFFYHYAAKMYYYIPRFQKLGVDCQIMEEWINWCQAAWPLIDWSVFRNKGEMQISPQLKDNTFCSGNNIIKAIGTNLPASPVFTWKVNGVTSSTTGVELSANNINPGDVVTCQITTTSSCVALKTVQATIVMPSKGYNLTMRKVGEANFRPLGNISACTNDKVELKMNIDLQPKQWLDAMDVNSGAEPTNGSKIASWWDKTGHGFNADANKTELQPTYLTNGLNGLPAVVFGNDNNADGLELFSTSEDAFMNNDWTIMFVAQSEKPTGNDDWRDIIGNKTEGSNGWFWRFSSTARVQMGIGPDLQHGKEYNFSRSYIVQITKKGDIITCYLNGRSDRIITKGANVTMRLSDAIYIGQSAGGNQFSNRYHKGPISELLVFESAITDAQKEFLEGYLTNKWKLSNELDYTHTYYTNSPFDITVNAPDGSNYKFDAVNTSQTINVDQTSKFGTYNFIKQVCGTTVETMSVTNACVAQSPYGGTAWPIPGRIEVENYDLGGEGVAYHDNETTNYGGAFRTTDGVDVGNCPEGGYNIGFIGGGEWTEYTVNATKTSVYTLGIRVATPNAGKSLHIEVDGVNISGNVMVPVTGSWDTYQTVSVTTPSITAGQHVVKIVMDTDGFNFNYVDFIINGAPVISSNANATGVIGKPFKYTIIASNNPTGYSATGLPAGLTINATTGVISGTATTAGTYTVTVSAVNGVATVSKLVTVTIKSKMDIAPFGDSITQSNTEQTSYRYPLWKKLIDANIPFNYVGSETTNFGGNPTTQVPYNGIPFDTDNEGHWGIGTNDFANNYVANWSNLYSPDLVLLHLGTNDVASVPTTTSRDNLIRIITRVREVNPYAVIFIAKIIPRGGTVYTAYNDMIAALGASLNTVDSPVIVVDQATGFNTTTDTWDGTHPNAIGDEKMAVRWFEAINAYLNPAVAPVVSSAATANGTVGTAFTYNITASNTPTSYGATGLPAGLTVNTSTGAITGTPTTAGNFNTTVSATNAGGTGSKALVITITSPATGSGLVRIENGDATTGWNGGGNALTVDATSHKEGAGCLQSTGTGIEQFSKVLAPVSTNANGYLQFWYYVSDVTQFNNGDQVELGSAGRADSLEYSWSLTNLQNGWNYISLKLSNAGITKGAPNLNAINWFRIYHFNKGNSITTRIDDILLTNASGNLVPLISTVNSASGTSGSAFSIPNIAYNDPTSYSATGLPAGVTINTTTGAITGTPTASGTFNTVVSATNTVGTSNRAVTITIGAVTPVVSSAATASGTIGTAFTYTITASNTPTSYGATGLPAGVSVNTSTGVITGTPTTAGTFNATVSATNAAGTGTKAVTITIAVAAPVVSSAATATGTTGTAFTYNITASNTPTSYGATGLPAGLSVNTSTGAITGTPTTAGTSNVTISATNAGGTGTKAITITIGQAAPVVFSATTASGTVGVAFSYNITASNSPASYGATGLPAGLSVNTTTGAITGTPTAAGTSSVTVSATNAGGTGSQTVTITINAPAQTPYGGTAWPIPGKIEMENYDNGGEGIAYHDNEVNNYGGAFRTTEGVDVGNCPEGTYNIGFIGTGEWTEYTVNVATAAAYTLEARVATPNPNRSFHIELDGVNISNTINVPLTNSWDVYQTVNVTTSTLTAGQHILRMYVDAGDFNFNYINFAPIVAAPVVSSAATASGTTGTAFTYNITASNTPTSFGATGLPAGLSVNTSTGAITGTPTAAGTFNATVSATNAGGTGTKVVTITIAQAVPVVSSAATASGTVGVAFSYNITATNTPTSYAATGLPLGLSVNTSTGAITGTPTAAGTSTITVSATNAGGTGSKTVTVTISTPVSTPYGGTAWLIPGTIQAENYDDGGEGIAYHDNDVANNGAQQRTNQGVDVENTGDNLGGTYNVGFTNAGEWMKYTVNVQTTGVYTLQARVAAPGTGSSFRVELDGTTIGTIAIPNTTGWQTYQTVSVITPSITSGAHVLRLYEETGGFNVNYIAFVSGAQSAPVITSATTASATLGNAFTYNITASNTPTSYNATGLPSGLTINTSTGVISGTPVNSGTSNISISATNAAGTGTATLALNVTAQNDPAGTITAYRNLNAITVNGTLTETGWNLNKSITKTVFGTVNNTATFGAMWDNTNLYIGVKVLDGNLYSDSPDWWEDDAVEIYIDANNNKLATYDGFDNQIIKGYNKSGISTKLGITGLQHAWAVTTGGYTVEIAIPWSQLGVSPTAGTAIGFDIGYNDDDNGGSREGQAMWNGTIDNWQNTSQFGTLRLNAGFASKFGDLMNSEFSEATSAVSIQPNIITNGVLNVVVPSQWSGNAEISILNVNGSSVQTSVETIGSNRVSTDISELKQGIYFMKIIKDSEVFTEKFIVQ